MEGLRKLTKAEISAYEAMSWDDLRQEELEAYKEAELENQQQRLTEEEQSKIEEDWAVFMREYAEYSKKRAKEVYGDNIPQPGDVPIEKQLIIPSFELLLPKTIEGLNEEAEKDPFYYIPNNIREHIIHHDYVINLLSYYMTSRIIHYYDNQWETLGFMVEEASSSGLIFRKMYAVHSNYVVLFFNFTDRTEDTMIEDFKKNKKIITYEESKEMKKKIEEIEAKMAIENIDALEQNEDIRVGNAVELDDNETDSVIIDEQSMNFDSSDVNSYVYSTLTVVIICRTDPKRFPVNIAEKLFAVIRYEKFESMPCMFHNMYLLPSC